MSHLIMKIRVIFPLLLCFLSSCVEEVGDFMQDNNLLVIDAVVNTTDTIQYVYVSQGAQFSLDEETPPVDTRLVTLTDDLGRVDTFSVSANGVVCSLYRPDIEVGRTYTVDVWVADRHFSATQTVMPHPIIKGVKFYYHDTKDDTLLNPLFYFEDNDPEADNYYLIHSEFDINLRARNRAFYPLVMPVSDAGLKSSVNGLRLTYGLGAGTDDRGEWDGLSYGQSYHYELSSVSREVYLYFVALEKQISSDGGIYQPAPSSPITNFEGDGVQGLFIAAGTYVFEGEVRARDIIER